LAKKKTRSAIEREALSMRDRIYSHWAELLVLNIVAVFPLYLNSQKYFGLTGHKAMYLWISSMVFFIILALIALTFTGMVKSKGFSFKNFSLPDWAVIAYWFSVVLSAVFSPMPNYYFDQSNFTFFLTGIPEPGGRYDGIITITIYVMLYFAVSRMYRNRNRDWAIFAVSACIVSIIGIFQFVGVELFNLYPYGHDSPTVAGIHPFNYLFATFRTTLGNVNIVSPYVCIVICFFMSLYMKSDKRIRFFYLAAAAATFGLMITAGADGGKMGVLAGVALLFVLNITDKRAISRMFITLSLGCLISIFNPLVYAARDYYYQTGIEQTFYWGENWYRNIWIWGTVLCFIMGLIVHFLPIWIRVKRHIAAIVITAAMIIVAFVGIQVMGPRLAPGEGVTIAESNIVWQAYETMRGNFDDMFGSGRAVIWKVTAETVLFFTPMEMLFGTGPDTFGYAVGGYQEYLVSVTGTPFDRAHNEFLQILICHGFIGLIAFLLFIGSLAVSAFRKIWDSPLLMAAITACGAYLVQAFFGISTPIVAPLFFVMCGLTENIRMGRHEPKYNEQDV
jgi:hypothetical protein